MHLLIDLSILITKYALLSVTRAGETAQACLSKSLCVANNLSVFCALNFLRFVYRICVRRMFYTAQTIQTNESISTPDVSVVAKFKNTHPYKYTKQLRCLCLKKGNFMTLDFSSSIEE